MSLSLGEARLFLTGPDLNTLLALWGQSQVQFRSGCFQLTIRLPMGMGASLVVLPQSAQGQVHFLIPLDQVRGDKTGKMVSFLASSLWGTVRSQIEKKIRATLEQHGLPPQTLIFEADRTDRGGKVGVLVLRLELLNAWLLRLPPQQGFHFQVLSMSFFEEGLQCLAEVFRQPPSTLPQTPRYR